jgi:hypothetical protein
MSEGQRGGLSRYAISIGLSVLALVLIGCGTLTLLPRQSDASAHVIRSLKDLAAAYARVQPGLTRASQLSQLGFDSGTPNVQVLSYFGVLERFMPGDSVRFDKLNDAVRSCIIEARDRCKALVIQPADQRHASSGGMFAALGFGQAKAATPPAQVTLLLQNGRVAYKMISGLPFQPPRRVAVHAAPRPATIDAAPVAYRVLY